MSWILLLFSSILSLDKGDKDLVYISYEQTSSKSRIEDIANVDHQFPCLDISGRPRGEQMYDGARRRLLSNDHHDFICM